MIVIKNVKQLLLHLLDDMVIISTHPSALIIVGHQAPPLLAATAGPRGPGRLV